ncbi:hypothetical protein KKH30_04780 [Candidatus Micrarchaeota archaeon]|nr:hypothetical protein [Candidatus Micrarchaeota archaeon]MBU1940053.1 hypothetical protein [Candidatus Micrarchaeota archaeon]
MMSRKPKRHIFGILPDIFHDLKKLGSKNVSPEQDMLNQAIAAKKKKAEQNAANMANQGR